MGNTAINDLIVKQKSKVKGVFFLDSVKEYESPGYGFIKQTDPLLAFYKGFSADKSFYEAKLLSEKTKAAFTEKTEEKSE